MSDLTQITFKTSRDLKETALQKTKRDGITLKALLTMAMRAYIENELKVGVGLKDEGFDRLFADKDIVRKANKLGEVLGRKDI